MADLELVPTEDMIAEIAGRHDAIVILGANFLDVRRHTTLIRFKGLRHMLIGMAHDALTSFQDMDSEPSPTPEEYGACEEDE